MEGITLSEISQTEKDKYYMISLVCDLKNKTSEYNNNKKKLTDTEDKPVVIGEREGGSKIGVGDWATYSLYKINKPQEYIIQQREYSQYLTITVNGV